MSKRSDDAARPGARRLTIVISGPSGVGKSTIIKRIRAARTGPITRFSISATTRAPRGKEKDGVHYHFLDERQFRSYIKQGQFIEWEQVHNHFYGTLKSEVDRAFEANEDIILEIDVKGARKVRKALPDSVMIFLTITPEVLERRLRSRGTEKEADIRLRLKNAKMELEAASEYDYIVVNDELDVAVQDIRAILRAERSKNPAKLKAAAQ